MTSTKPISNEEIAAVLERVAELLEAQKADAFRVRAYRTAAHTVAQAKLTFAGLAHEPVAMMAYPGIGSSIASAIQEYVATGCLRMLDRLEGQVSPEDLFMTVPGIGETLAHRIHDLLHIETLEDLELAAHDGRLEQVLGFSARRIEAVKNSLHAILSQSLRARARMIGVHKNAQQLPPLPLLLEIDGEYRRKASANDLWKIAPLRFNPSGEAWLPIMHVVRDEWHFTVLFSNSARAHKLGKTHDWVIIFHEFDGHEGQCTVVTERKGTLEGQRVVRGREDECLQLYRAEAVVPARSMATMT